MERRTHHRVTLFTTTICFFITSIISPAVLAQSFSETEEYCASYSSTGEYLQQSRGVVDFQDGAILEQVVEGPLRMLRLRFNRTVDLKRAVLQFRVNPTVRVFTSNNQHKFVTRNSSEFFHLQADRLTPLQTDLPEQLPINVIMLQGFDAQLTYDEILLVNFTVCAHDCQAAPGCFGNCKPLMKDFGCMECSCPRDSISSGCSGISNKDVIKLYDSDKNQLQPGCQFRVGYRRQIHKALNFDDCVPFTYPKCPFYNKVIIPKTKIQCLSHCY
ncbi:hypothetical protein T4E_10439 [Trichinella pseudospiralis]|uniref:Uncharacterized protein n=1 Tax=Trichinella pseudospiralis TaxID=6337 RepID=A0A0V0Y3A1_TRIPS|nr:hypothetical protein T4E_10439 [Trichinella pseudospiralis]KRY86273.1 hypothetical protein T4D_1930 [Trichinella pseudospiralis]